jgi:hypothetical protein
MTIAWSEPARRLARDLPERGIAGLWALLHTAELAVLQMALLPGLNDDLRLTQAAFDLQEAVEQLEGLHPSTSPPARSSGERHERAFSLARSPPGSASLQSASIAAM